MRAEILGAFFNAVFLIALCVSIILEAIVRFIDPPEITNPQMILIVGCFGLASNLVGFLVLGGHGHDHGHDKDDHSHGHDEATHIEEGHGHDHGRDQRESQRLLPAGAEDGRPIDILPEVAVARATAAPASTGSRHIKFGTGDETGKPIDRCTSNSSASQNRGRERRRGSSRHSRLTSIDDLRLYPSSFRQDIIDASLHGVGNTEAGVASSDEDQDDSNTVADSGSASPSGDVVGELDPLLGAVAGKSASPRGYGDNHKPYRKAPSRARGDSVVLHSEHNHCKPRKAKSDGHGHSHGDMGMNAMVLHVLGDALGNVGVIITALVIWLTDWSGKYYTDPAVSLFITLIILKSAVPLTKATANVLLQATPDHIDVAEIKEDIQALPGVLSCHHVHIWQLSDTKVVASLHVQVSFPINEAGGEKYMELARRARRCLHAYGIHSATIQPEFCLDALHQHPAPGAGKAADNGGADDPASKQARRQQGKHRQHRQGHQHPTGNEPLRLDGAGGNNPDGSTPDDSQATTAVSDPSSPVRCTAASADFCLLRCVDDCAGEECCDSTGQVSSSFSDDGHSH